MTHDADRTLEWPDGSRFRITRSTADTGGELLEMELELPPRGWAPQPHIHPDLTEEYEVLEGSLDVLIGSEWRTLTKGATAAVALRPFPPSESETARCAYVIRIIPLDFEPYIKRLCSAGTSASSGI